MVTQLEYTLGMPPGDATDHASFAKEQGYSCLGVWKREECLDLGKKLQLRDIVCRVVPGAEGGGRQGDGRDVPATGRGRPPPVASKMGEQELSRGMVVSQLTTAVLLSHAVSPLEKGYSPWTL